MTDTSTNKLKDFIHKVTRYERSLNALSMTEGILAGAKKEVSRAQEAYDKALKDKTDIEVSLLGMLKE
jgi:hypothetical protein